LSIAASLLVVGAIALLLYRPNHAGNDYGNNVVWKTTNVPMGRKGKVTLTDGSSIELNGGASISYPDCFVASERTIKLLRGDAFFAITKDAHHPFIVQTANNTRIKVLGTRFNVKQNDYKSRIEITLNSGKISFERDGKPAQLLFPGQRLYYSCVSNTISTLLKVDTSDTNAWRKNILLFKDTPIPQALYEIEQFYGVKFKNQKIYDSQLISAQFENEPLSRVLMLLGKSTKLDFYQNGTIIHINR